jgi:hypothetical protein
VQFDPTLRAGGNVVHVQDGRLEGVRPPMVSLPLGGLRVFQFENNYFTEMCSGSEAGSYLRLTDFVYHSTLGLKVITEKRKT